MILNSRRSIVIVIFVLYSLLVTDQVLATETVDDLIGSPQDVLPWDWTDCHNGTYYSNETANVYGCECDSGWNGTDCSMCLDDDSCSDGYICDKTAVISEYKAFNCMASITGLGAVTAQFTFPPNAPQGYGVVSAFHRSTGAPFLFNCSFTECTKTVSTTQQIISCAASTCECTEKCSTILSAIIPKVSGTSTFTCSLTDDSCNVSPGIKGTQFPVDLTCQFASCQKVPYIKPPPLFNTWQLVLLIVGSVLVFVLLISLVVLVCWLSRRRDRKRYAKFRHHEEPKVSLSFDHVGCTIGSGKSKKRILRSLTGVCPSGQLTAILGPSGAGKTSFLDILAGRKNVGQVTGEVLINGCPRKKNFQRISGYVLQDEKLIGTLTVREHLNIVARLRLPAAMPYNEKMEKVESVMTELGIQHISDSKIGTDMTRGISGGEKRRVSIATELVTDPRILFLDEPTSGLDSTSACALVQTLVTLSRHKNRTIITTIHQPNSKIYELFDNVMLLSRGQMVYYGPASEALLHFEDFGHHCPRNYNPADFLLDLVATRPNEFASVSGDEEGSSGVNSMTSVVSDHYRGRTERSPLISRHNRTSLIVNSMSAGEEYVTEESEESQREYASYWIDQLWVLCKRTMLNNIRNPVLLALQYLMFSVLGVMLGLIFFHLDYDARGTQDRFGALFFMVSLLMFSAMSSIDLFFHDRGVFVRERATGMYSTSAYFFAKVLSDIIPMRIIPSILLGSIPYYMMRLHEGIEHFSTLIAVLVLLSIVSVSLCFVLSTVTPSVGVANLLLIVIMLFNMLFGGFLINKATMPRFIQWIKYTSFINYAFEILCVNEFVGTSIEFNPVGYPVNTTIDGLVFLEQFDMSPSRVNRDYILLGSMGAAQLMIAYLFLRFLVKERR